MPIPEEHRKLIDQDSWFERCCRCSKPGVQIHHVFIYGKNQIAEMFNYVPACPKCHEKATPHNNNYKQEARDYFEWVVLQRAEIEDLAKYPKKDWQNHIRYLLIQADKHNWK